MSELLALPCAIPTKLNGFLPLTGISARTRYPCRSHHLGPYPSTSTYRVTRIVIVVSFTENNIKSIPEAENNVQTGGGTSDDKKNAG